MCYDRRRISHDTTRNVGFYGLQSPQSAAAVAQYSVLSSTMSGEESLEERVSTLRAELRSYGRDIHQHLSGLFGASPACPIDLTSNPMLAIPMLHADVLELLQTAKDLRHEQAMEELLECQRMISALKTLHEVIDAIENVSKFSTSSDIPSLHQAILLMNEKQGNLLNLPNNFGNSPVIGFVVKEMKLQHSQYCSRLRRLVRSCFHMSLGKIQVAKILTGLLPGEEDIIETPIRLVDLWNFLLATGHAQDIVNEVIREVWLQVFLPLWREKKVAPPKITNDDVASSLTYESITKAVGNQSAVKAVGDRQLTCRMPISSLLDLLGAACSFLWSEVFCANEDVIDVKTFFNLTYKAV